MGPSNLKLERPCTSKHKGCSKLNKALLQKFQLSPEISAHQLSAALPIPHPDGHCFFDVLSALAAKCSLNSVKKIVFCKLNCWSITKLLQCKHSTALFGHPCYSHALLKSSELQALLFAAVLLDSGFAVCSWFNCIS